MVSKELTSWLAANADDTRRPMLKFFMEDVRYLHIIGRDVAALFLQAARDGDWEPHKALYKWEEELGANNYATSCPQLRSARGELAADGSGRWIDDAVFSDYYKSFQCDPDFNNAISTFAVYDKYSPGRVCFRFVHCISFTELVARCKDDYRFDSLKRTWLEGRAVVRPKCKRPR